MILMTIVPVPQNLLPRLLVTMRRSVPEPVGDKKRRIMRTNPALQGPNPMRPVG
jgi:hypothetical protein